MPCDSGQSYSYSGEDYQARRELSAMKQELDSVTGMLCALLRQLDGRVFLPPEIAKWFHDHKEHDKAQGRL
jgi:hypothetical protein